MYRTAFVITAVAMAAVVYLLMEQAEAQQHQLVPAALPPWSNMASGTETDTKPPPAAAPTPSVEPNSATPGQRNAITTQGTPVQGTPVQGTPVQGTPVQGTTTPIQAVSLRSGPNTGSPVIGTLRPGTPVRVLASANYGWMQVETSAGSGWTYGSYLAPIGGTAVVQPPPEPPGELLTR